MLKDMEKRIERLKADIAELEEKVALLEKETEKND